MSLKIADIYNPKFECGSIPSDSAFYQDLNQQIEKLCLEVKNYPGVMQCQFRDKITLPDLVSEEAWEKYKKDNPWMPLNWYMIKDKPLDLESGGFYYVKNKEIRGDQNE